MAAITKAPTITYGRTSFSLATDTIPMRTSTTTTTGTSKVVVVVLVRMGIVSVAKLKEVRPYVIVGAFVIAAIVTPPDVVSQFSLAIPMWVLFELGLLVAPIFVKATQAPEEPV